MSQSTAAAPEAAAAPEGFEKLLSTVRETVQSETAKINARLDEQQQQIEELAKPQRSPSEMFATGRRFGESPNTSRGYSFIRAIGLMYGLISKDQCKVEIEMSNRLQKLYVENNSMVKAEKNSILVPLAADHIAIIDAEFAHEVRQTVRAGVIGCDSDEVAWYARRLAADHAIRQTLSQWDNTAGGAFIPPAEQGELIELMRAREVLTAAGAREMPLPPNGRLVLPRQTGATTAHWVGERKSTTASEPETGSLALIAKKMGVLVKSPNELFKFATPSWEQFLRTDMARVAALKLDRDALVGAPSAVGVKGLIHYSGVTNSTGGAGIVATDTNGDTLLAQGPSNLIGVVEDHNFESDDGAFLLRPKLWRQILNKRGDAVATGDAAGPFLFGVNRQEMRMGVPPQLEDQRVVKSTQIPKDRVKAGGTTLTMLFYGIWRHFVVARAGVMEFSLSREGDTPFTQDETWIKCIMHVDAGPLDEGAFTYVDDLLESV